jgi:hypothetical protein
LGHHAPNKIRVRFSNYMNPYNMGSIHQSTSNGEDKHQTTIVLRH